MAQEPGDLKPAPGSPIRDIKVLTGAQLAAEVIWWLGPEEAGSATDGFAANVLPGSAGHKRRL